MHFPLFQISLLFPTNLSDSVENFPNFTFSRKISRFSSAKISDDLFLSHRLKILIPHLFSLFHYILPPISRKLSFPLLLQISSSVFGKFMCFLHTLCVFRFPPTLTMMHFCITQCTYWTLLLIGKSVLYISEVWAVREPSRKLFFKIHRHHFYLNKQLNDQYLYRLTFILYSQCSDAELSMTQLLHLNFILTTSQRIRHDE